MSEVEQAQGGEKVPFDWLSKDCFGPSINKTDDQVTTLILETRLRLQSEGEYDQGDRVVLDWDEARDLTQVAETLWKIKLRESENRDAVPGDAKDRVTRFREALVKIAGTPTISSSQEAHDMAAEAMDALHGGEVTTDDSTERR